MESSVDLPQPDGPAMETYSPLRMSMWMPDRACVSTSSVRKTFVTPSSLIREGLSVLIVWARWGGLGGLLTRDEAWRLQKLFLGVVVGGDECGQQSENEGGNKHGRRSRVGSN